jgi:Fe-S cluster biogenesis protein NfuA
MEMTTEIERARKLIKEVQTIVKRAKISERAEKFLRLTDLNLQHPEPVMLQDIPDGKFGDFDIGNIYVTLEGACDLLNVSHSTIRMLVSERWLEQRHYGKYRLKDLVRAWAEHQESLA